MLERVVEIIKEQLNLDGVEITEDSSFKDDLGADSLDLLYFFLLFARNLISYKYLYINNIT